MKRLILLILVMLIGFYVGWPAWSGYQIRQALERKDAESLSGKIDFPAVRTGLQPYVSREVGTALDGYLAGLGPLANLISPQIKQQYLKSITDTAINTLITPANIIRIYAQKGNMRAAAEKILMEELSKAGGILGGGAPAAGGGGSSGGGVGAILDKFRTPGGFGEAAGKALQGAGAPTGQLPSQGDIVKGVIAKMREKRAAKPETAQGATSGGGKGGFGLANIKQFGFNGPLAMLVGVAKDGSAPKPDVIGEMAFRGLDWKVVRIVPGE